MQRYEFCGAEFSDHASFCGHCGHAPGATLEAPTASSLGQPPAVPGKEEEERRRREGRRVQQGTPTVLIRGKEDISC